MNELKNILIEVMSIDECRKYYDKIDGFVNFGNCEPCIIWCVSPENVSLCNFNNVKPKNFLRLVFDDIDTESVLQSFINEHGTYNLRALRMEDYEKFILFDETHVEQLLNFFQTQLEPFKRKLFIICCEAGISRSAAIGDFLAEVFSQITDNYKIHYHFLLQYAYRKHPNMRVQYILNQNRGRFIEILSNKIM